MFGRRWVSGKPEAFRFLGFRKSPYSAMDFVLNRVKGTISVAQV